MSALHKIDPKALHESPRVDELVPPLLRVLEMAPEPSFYAAETLELLGPKAAPAAVPGLLRAAMREKQRNGTMSVTRNIAGMGEAVAPHLIKALDDTDADIREAAAQALGDVELLPSSVLVELKKVGEHDPDEAVRVAARISIRKISERPQLKTTTAPASRTSG